MKVVKVVAPNLGLKRMTRPNSTMLKTAPGGKELVHDSSKTRKYKLKGETGWVPNRAR